MSGLVVQIRLVVEFVLEREGVIVTRYVDRPMQGFSLQNSSTIEGCLIQSLTLFKAWKADRTRRRDLVAFRLTTLKDARKFIGGDEVLLKDIEACGYLRDRS